ncbi:MAG: hypothetical protein D6772_00390 [Bacteroidetes bacterium]|nr:MAG: hypothetical protein D6772_00390 [Bacteroidota bacterium]
MTTRGDFSFSNNNQGPFSGLMGIVIAVLFFIGLFWFMQFLFKLLWMLLPVMIVVTAIIDYKVILSYFGWMGRLFSSNWVAGAAMGALTIFGAPIVALFLMGKALLGRKIKNVQAEVERQREAEFTEYEEVDSEILDLPRIERPEPQHRKGEDYEDLFR